MPMPHASGRPPAAPLPRRTPGAARPLRATAHDRLKARGETWFWRGLTLAVLAHVAVFTLAPAMLATAQAEEEDYTALMAPPAPELPEPPQSITRPAQPVVSAADIPDDVTITSTNEWDAVSNALPAPPTQASTEVTGYAAFVPSMTAPRVLNKEEVERALRQHYPPTLRQAGIGHTVDVLLYLNAEGGIDRAEVAEKGPYPSLDAAALKVVEVMRLSPAMNRDRAVAVVVRLPVVFAVH